MKIVLITPAGARSRAGNRHTALRWAAFLRAAGHDVAIATQWQPDEQTELMLALHARRSHPSISAFRNMHRARPLLLALTGTDVYRDIRVSVEARQSLRLASAFIVLQPKASEELAPAFRSRAHTVIQSCATRLRQRPVTRRFRICVIGHLRDEKDPMRALEALRFVPGNAIDLVQIGESLEQRFAVAARAAMKSEPRYRWLGSLPHARALRWLASSHAMVISSRMEGGANVVSEAIRIGVPVIASRISGNLGLLGDDYAAYFAPGNTRALAALLRRTSSDPAFCRELARHIAKLRPMVDPRSEARMLLAALRAATASA